MLRRSLETIAMAASVFLMGFLLSAVVYASCNIGQEGTFVESFTIGSWNGNDFDCQGTGYPHCGSVLCADDCVSASYMIACTFADAPTFGAIAPMICGEGCF